MVKTYNDRLMEELIDEQKKIRKELSELSDSVKEFVKLYRGEHGPCRITLTDGGVAVMPYVDTSKGPDSCLDQIEGQEKLEE